MTSFSSSLHPKLPTGISDELDLNIVTMRARLQVSNYSAFVLGVASSLTPEGEGGRRRGVGVPFTLAVARLIALAMHTVRYTEMAPDRFKNFWKD